MSQVKCLSCKKLIREEVFFDGKDLVGYSCHRFSYGTAVALSSLFKPAKIVAEAARECPETCQDCAVCGFSEELITYSIRYETHICKEHDRAFDAWLGSHSDRLSHIKPRIRVNSRRWYEVFREFVETLRKCRNCGCTWEHPCISPEGACSWADWNLCNACQEKEK